MHPLIENEINLTRRHFFGDLGLRFGGVALAHFLGKNALASTAPEAPLVTGQVHPALPGLPHFAPKAKRVIYLHMNGGPSQLDTWDYKPRLVEQFDKELPPSIRGGGRLTTMTSGQSRFPIAPSKYKFAQHGNCGRWVSELLPHTAKMVDEIALVKTVHTNAINHDPACTFLFTGSEIPGKPCVGSWLAYGLGAETSNLPAFVALTPSFPPGSNGQALYSRLWGNGFLPGKYAGVAFRSGADPVLYLQNPNGVQRDDRRALLDTLASLNQRQHERLGDPETLTRIAQYEMAFRMQASVPDLVDLKGEDAATLALYGADVNRAGSFAQSCLLARRLVERGVRCVQILHRGWDSHGNLPTELGNQCKDTDQGCAALLQDLKQRGMLDDTLVIWGGEFGRTVYSQGTLTRDNYGRDHHPQNYCMWLAGGGVKGGLTYGETDDYSYNPVENPVHLNDLNATILHCLGIDHSRFTYKFQGLDQRLTGVEPAKVVKALLA
jgi:uncharacterized protein (DUF1501 family)